MKVSLDKLKDWMISLDMYMEQEGPFLKHLELFYESIQQHDKKYWKQLIESLQTGLSFDQSVIVIKHWMHPSLYPMFVLLGNTLYPFQVTQMILSRIERIQTLLDIKKKVLKYPQIVSMLMFTLIVMYLLVMVPLYETMFLSYQFESSSFMKTLIAISAFIRFQPFIIVVIMIFFVLSIYGIKYIFHRYLYTLQYHIVFFKDVSRLKLYSDVTYMLSIWLQTNMTLTEAIEHTITLSPKYIQEGLREGLQALLEGATFKTFIHFLPNPPHDMESIVSHVQEDKQLVQVLQLL